MLFSLETSYEANLSIHRNKYVELWHRRLGHTSLQIFQRMNFAGKADKIELCFGCSKGKRTQDNHSKRAEHAASILQQVDADATGPFIVSFNGCLNTLIIIIDERSRNFHLSVESEMAQWLYDSVTQVLERTFKSQESKWFFSSWTPNLSENPDYGS